MSRHPMAMVYWMGNEIHRQKLLGWIVCTRSDSLKLLKQVFVEDVEWVSEKLSSSRDMKVESW